MTIRVHHLPASLDGPVPASPKAAPSTPASPAEIKNDHEPEAMPATARLSGNEKADIGSAKDDSDIVASCEDKGAAKAPDVGKSCRPSARKKEFTPSVAVQAAIERCVAVRVASGSFIGWGERSEVAASASLDLVAKMSDDYDALKFVRQNLNDDRKQRGERALNKSTPKELLAVYMCAPPNTKADRQECSRFANVISVAVAEKRTPENVGAWLKATTLSDVLEKAQVLKSKPSNKTYSVAITRNKYPQLWENFRTEEVRTAIDKALKSVDNSLRKAARNGR